MDFSSFVSKRLKYEPKKQIPSALSIVYYTLNTFSDLYHSPNQNLNPTRNSYRQLTKKLKLLLFDMNGEPKLSQSQIAKTGNTN